MLISVAEVDAPKKKRKCGGNNCPWKDAIQEILRNGFSVFVGALDIVIYGPSGFWVREFCIPPQMKGWIRAHDEGRYCEALTVDLPIEPWAREAI
jgi:hypothetical protein